MFTFASFADIPYDVFGVITDFLPNSKALAHTNGDLFETIRRHATVKDETEIEVFIECFDSRESVIYGLTAPRLPEISLQSLCILCLKEPMSSLPDLPMLLTSLSMSFTNDVEQINLVQYKNLEILKLYPTEMKSSILQRFENNR